MNCSPSAGRRRIALRELFNEDEEGQYVVETIKELIHQKAATPGEIAIMYRTNAQCRPIEDAFLRADMPYKLVGATRFYARREVKDVLAYLRIISNPQDAVSLARIINVPARGVGEKTAAQLETTARERGLTPLDVLTQGQLTGRAAKALAEFGALWQSWITLRDELSVGQLVEHVLKSSGYRDSLRDGTDEGEDRIANIHELRNVAAEHGDVPLGDFLNNISLVSETDNLEAGDAPTLLTLHAAKGLEYRVVFIIGLIEGVLPHSRSLDDPEQMQEERRLMYVGITRAKERLYLLRPFRRSQWGMSDAAEPSRFLADLPPALVEGKLRKPAEIAHETSSWKAQATVRTPEQSATQFKPGDRVRHPTLGDGIVLKSTKHRDDEEVEVFFQAAGGGKRLSAAMSGIAKIAR